MKMSNSAHRNIFLLSCLCLTAILIIAAATADRGEKLHKSLYEQYEAANQLFEERKFQESYEVFNRLSDVYENSYVLELKMAVCAMNMDMWREAVAHSRRVLELYPLLAKDKDFMEALSYSLTELDELDAAARIDGYYKNIESLVTNNG